MPSLLQVSYFQFWHDLRSITVTHLVLQSLWQYTPVVRFYTLAFAYEMQIVTRTIPAKHGTQWDEIHSP